jgi:Putative peptidoglycan binding domain/Glycosyl hydrolase family 46
VTAAFSIGGVGFPVRDLQRALQIWADGEFGAVTRGAVKAAQCRAGLQANGLADEETFDALHLEWPDEFSRCLALTNAFEGTDFGTCNLRDIDGAGVTIGIIGFTTASGEVQHIIREFLSEFPEQSQAIGKRRDDLEELLRTVIRQRWENFFYSGGGVVRADCRAALRAWGEHPRFRELQTDFARERCWEPGCATAKRLGFESMAARGLMLDVWVQDGGWRVDHERAFRRLETTEQPEDTEEKGLWAAAEAAAVCATDRWRADVRARKMVFATGAGEVHGRGFALSAQGF